MLDNNTEECQLGDRHVLGGTHDGITVSDAGHVFHGAVFVVRTHHVVNFRERVSLTKCLLVKIKSGLGDTKNELMSQVLD